MTVLSIQQLNILLWSKHAFKPLIHDLSLEIQEGETYGLIGESGSGKSITALSIMGLLPKTLTQVRSGSIELLGQSLLGAPESTLQNLRGSQVSMIFQEPMSCMNPVLSIGSQVMEVLNLHFPELSEEEAKERILNAFDHVKLKHPQLIYNAYPMQLSGGQLQRIMIVMALICGPRLLIADEPTTALDVTTQAEILALLRALQDQMGLSLLLISHDFSVISNMAHRIGVLRSGCLVEENKTSAILYNPKHDYTQALLNALPERLPRLSTRNESAVLAKQAQPSPILLETKQLNVCYPIKTGIFNRVTDHYKAVHDVSLQIPQGQIVALVGESGSGKSTLGRAIIGLEPIFSGQVLFNGENIHELSAGQLRAQRARMQIAFQDPFSSLNPRMTIERMLNEILRVHGRGQNNDERISIIEQTMESVHLPAERIWSYPHQFSGGQRQRISLARALILNPEFIVCDEVTSALDVSVQAEILQLLQDIRQKYQLSLLFISHDINVVHYLCDEVWVMHQGQIVENGLTDQVCFDPQNDYTKSLLSSVLAVPAG